MLDVFAVWLLFYVTKTCCCSVGYMGSRRDNGDGLLQKDHEGHPGWSTDVLQESLEWVFPDWKADPNPFLVLLTIGSNAFLLNNDNPTASSTHDLHEKVANIVRGIVQRRPNVHVILNTVPPLWLDNLVMFNTIWFNDQLVDIVKQLKEENISVALSDAGGSLTLQDLYDGIHPSKQGYEKMATVLTQTIISSIFAIQNPPSPPPPAPLMGDEACCNGSFGQLACCESSCCPNEDDIVLACCNIPSPPPIAPPDVGVEYYYYYQPYHNYHGTKTRMHLCTLRLQGGKARP